MYNVFGFSSWLNWRFEGRGEKRWNSTEFWCIIFDTIIWVSWLSEWVLYENVNLSEWLSENRKNRENDVNNLYGRVNRLEKKICINIPIYPNPLRTIMYTPNCFFFFKLFILFCFNRYYRTFLSGHINFVSISDLVFVCYLVSWHWAPPLIFERNVLDWILWFIQNIRNINAVTFD